MQSMTDILFSSWIGIMALLAIVFTILIGFWFRRWINNNIAADEAAIALKNNAEQKIPPSN